MRSTGSWYEVRAESGKVYRARLKGKFKLIKRTIGYITELRNDIIKGNR